MIVLNAETKLSTYQMLENVDDDIMITVKK